MPILQAVRRHFYRRKVLVCLSALTYPAKTNQLHRLLRDDVERFVIEGMAKQWPPETVASIIASIFVSNFIRNELTLLQRERCGENIRDLGPKGLIEEVNWMAACLRGERTDQQMDSFMFRFHFMNGLIASWLLQDRKIDIFTKSIFVTMTAQALGGVDRQTSSEAFDDLVGRIGTAPKRP